MSCSRASPSGATTYAQDDHHDLAFQQPATWEQTLCHAVLVHNPLSFAGDDIRQCERGVHVVSGTPGRVFDMIKRRSLRTRSIRTLVLDEADEMLNKGFKEQIYEVYRYLPPDTQVSLSL